MLTDTGSLVNGSTNMLLKINIAPFNGTCWVDLPRGYAMITYFTITCKNWVDIDGYIVRYEYFGKKKLFLFISILSSKILIRFQLHM